MIPEIGHFALIIALCLAILQIILPMIGIYKNEESFMQTARPLSVGQCFFVLVSFVCLAYAFYDNDFSLLYVARNSNSNLPLIYKISAIWGGHEGSMLLWVLILNIWTVALVLKSRNLELPFVAALLAILGIVSVGFLSFILGASSPYTSLLPDFPIEGRDLNPLLQDPGLILHPPLLYLGYVGFSVPFAFAVALLILARLEDAWIKWIRPFVLIAFGFLTLGVALGSWWAYYELGWGGWWFWDPVENASFMPWLVGIALIHTLIVSDKRKEQYAWLVVLAILCFALSLLGTFLIRSGMLTSVHAFASDPKRGLLMLQFLFLVVGGALILYAVRMPALLKSFRKRSEGAEAKTLDSKLTATSKVMANEKPYVFSRENLILFNSILLVITTATILLGTLFPIVFEAITSKKISVGFPYFNTVFIPLVIPILIFVPLGPFTNWGNSTFSKVFSELKWSFVLSLVLGFLFLFVSELIVQRPGSEILAKFSKILIQNFSDTKSFLLLLGFLLGLWLCFGTLQRLFFKIKQQGIKKVSTGAWGMCLAHFGVGVMVLGITVVSHYQIEREVTLKPGAILTLAGYQIKFQGVEKTEGSNFVGYRGHFIVVKNPEKFVGDLQPEKRVFVTPGIMMTETAIDPGFFRDIYIALGERLNDGTWSAKVYYKPFVRWIWLGALFIALGAMVAASSRKKQAKKPLVGL